MDLQTIRKRVASNISIVDSNGDLLTTDISSADIDNWINDRYLEEIFPAFADRRPNFYMTEGTFPNYVTTGTVSASSTGSTLVATTAIFTNNMIDGWAYNSTDDEALRITGYTNTTTLTLEDDIDDTWDGDTIYIFTGVFTFDISGTSMYRPDWIGVKYASTDKDFTRCVVAEDRDLYIDARGRNTNDSFSQKTPTYTFETVSVSSLPTSGIKIQPFNWQEAISEGVFVRYIKKPAIMTNNTDIPRLPIGHHKILVYGATADALRKLGKYNEAMAWDNSVREPWTGTGLYNKAFKQLLRMNVAEREQRTVNFGRRTSLFYRRNS